MLRELYVFCNRVIPSSILHCLLGNHKGTDHSSQAPFTRSVTYTRRTMPIWPSYKSMQFPICFWFCVLSFPSIKPSNFQSYNIVYKDTLAPTCYHLQPTLLTTFKLKGPYFLHVLIRNCTKYDPTTNRHRWLSPSPWIISIIFHRTIETT